MELSVEADRLLLRDTIALFRPVGDFSALVSPEQKIVLKVPDDSECLWAVKTQGYFENNLTDLHWLDIIENFSIKMGLLSYTYSTVSQLMVFLLNISELYKYSHHGHTYYHHILDIILWTGEL